MTDKNNIPRVKVFQQLKINVSNVMYVYKKKTEIRRTTHGGNKSMKQ